MALRLGTKILTTMALVLVLSSLVFFGLFLAYYQEQLVNERRTVSEKLGTMLQITLENAMLKRDLDGLRDIVNRLGQVPHVGQVQVVAPNGEVRFASDPAALGRNYDPLRLCPDCGIGKDKTLVASNFVTNEKGQEVLRAVNAVANREPCQVCHGMMDEHPINGYLVLDYSAQSIRQEARALAGMQALAGFLVIVGALGATWLLLRRLVLKPVDLFVSVSRALARGEFSARSKLAAASAGRGDEIAELGRTVDHMAARLDHTVSVLREHEAFQQSVIDGVPDGVRVIDENYRVVIANKAFCDQAGLTLDQVIGRACYFSSHGRHDPCVPTLVVCPLKELATSDMPIKCTHAHIHHPDRSGIATEVVAAPVVIQTADGKRRFIVEAIRSLAQNVQISQEQRLSELGELAAGVAHEIHNPLASIRLGIRAIQRALGSGDARAAREAELSDYLSVADTEIDRCITVTGRLMRLSRLPTEQGVLINVKDVADDIAALLHYEAEQSNVTITVDADPSLRIVAAEGELGMVLLNLVQNAIHAMPERGGHVGIAARRAERGLIEITVADDGSGIKTEHLSSIFLPFWTKRTDGTTGSGLGLSICSALITKRQGTVTVESKEGVGTVFRILFPNPDDITQDLALAGTA